MVDSKQMTEPIEVTALEIPSSSVLNGIVRKLARIATDHPEIETQYLTPEIYEKLWQLANRGQSKPRRGPLTIKGVPIEPFSP